MVTVSNPYRNPCNATLKITLNPKPSRTLTVAIQRFDAPFRVLLLQIQRGKLFEFPLPGPQPTTFLRA